MTTLEDRISRYTLKGYLGRRHIPSVRNWLERLRSGRQS